MESEGGSLTLTGGQARAVSGKAFLLEYTCNVQTLGPTTHPLTCFHLFSEILSYLLPAV